MRIRSLISALVALSLLAGACSTQVDRSTTSDAGVPFGSDGGHELVALEDDSTYVEALCRIDFFSADEDDPMGWVIDELGELPTSTSVEEDEVAWMVERLERSQSFDDPLESDDLTSVAALPRARCS